jgi:hypothetical protein
MTAEIPTCVTSYTPIYIKRENTDAVSDICVVQVKELKESDIILSESGWTKIKKIIVKRVDNQQINRILTDTGLIDCDMNGCTGIELLMGGQEFNDIPVRSHYFSNQITAATSMTYGKVSIRNDNWIVIEPIGHVPSQASVHSEKIKELYPIDYTGNIYNVITENGSGFYAGIGKILCVSG